MTPFDFIKQIHHGKKNLMVEDERTEEEYKPFIVNRGLSYSPDTVLSANEMNTRHHLDSRLQFDFLLNSIRPRKRFDKWIKRENNEKLELITEYYQCSYAKAREYAQLLDDSQMNVIRQRLDKGGR